MSDATPLFEIALRGAAAGTSVLLALALAAPGEGASTRRIGALFSLSAACYVLLSRPETQAFLGWAAWFAILMSINGTVFFWWFAAHLFDEKFRWRWWRLAPALFLPGLYLLRRLVDGAPVLATALTAVHIIINAALFADVLRLALAELRDDLVEPRRRFRVAVSAIVGVFGIAIAVAEIIELRRTLPEAAFGLQAAAVFGFNLLFGVWALSPRVQVFAAGAPALPAVQPMVSTPLSAADRLDFERLNALMEAGVYREEGLTVAKLASKVGLAEHQLRKLINGALGYRNFSAFVNARRIEDAKTMLANPANARKQILQIALDLGYGSIAPFNRAFKEETGETPSAFRKASLGDG